MLLTATRFGTLRRSTLSWYRIIRISASSRALDRISRVSAHANKLRKSIIGYEHHPIRNCSLVGIKFSIGTGVSPAAITSPRELNI
jgi:hypothetical protein